MNQKLMSNLSRMFAIAAIATAVPAGLAAQNHQVSGRVVANDLQPLFGVNVMVRGTTIGTITNAAGNYTLTAPNADATLVFSALGMMSREEAIAGRSVINVVMETQAIALEELVVVGYGQQTRASVSGAVSSISSEDIGRTSATTVNDMLSGKVAGINTRMTTTGRGMTAGRVPNDGRPGSAAVLQIRNMGEPLFVIDGIPSTPLEFSHLNAADIDNISILKDASASVYGFRAANGVVLVTTKKGGELRTPQVRLDGYYGWQNLPRSRYPGGFGDNSYQLKYSYVESQQNRGEQRSISRDELEAWRLGGPGYPDREMWKFFVQENVPQAQVNASVQGGSDQSTYYLSLGHVTQDYAIRDMNFNRTNLQANLQTDLFGGVRVGAEIRGRLEKHKVVAITDSQVPTDPLLHLLRAVNTAWPFEDPYANSNPAFINGDVHYFVRSPVAFTRETSGYQDQIRTNVNGNFWAEYTLPFGTTARATYSRTKDLEEFEVHRYTWDGYCYDANSDTYDVCQQYTGATRNSIRGVGDQDFLQVQLSQALTRGAHSLSGVAVVEKTSFDRTESELFSVPPTNFNPLIDLVDIRDAGTELEVERRASLAGRLNYDYASKYLLEAVGRYDGSYLYAPSARWGFFPGFSVGWRITQEPFFQNALPFLNELKLRASWGQAGRERTGNFPAPWAFLGGATYAPTQGQRGFAPPGVLDGQVITGISPRGLPVTNLSWVTSTSRNLGVDFVLLDGKLAGEFDVFERRLTGLPAPRYDVALPSELGYTLPDENLESEANVGFDGMIRFNDRVGSVSYSIAPNFTLARRKILERYKPRFGSSWDEYRNGQEGRWAGATSNSSFTYHVIGQFQSVEEILRHPVNIDGQGNRTLLPGDYIFDDVNGDGVINTLDQRPLGFETGTTPVLSYGFNGSFSYRGFTLNYDLAGGGIYQWNPHRLVSIPHGTDYNGYSTLSNRWRRADAYDDNSEWIPGKLPPLRRAENSASSYRASDANRISVNFLRLKRLELGFQLPGDLAEHLGIANLRTYASIANPLLYDNTRRYAIDPELANGAGFQHPYMVVTNVGFSASLGGAPSLPIPVVPIPPVDDT